jgi:hypothetical protein
MLQLLPEERWPELAEIFRTEFDSELPHRGKASIMADVDDETGEIRGFMVLEFLARIGQVYSTGGKTRRMFELIEEQIPPCSSVIAIASEPRFEGLCEKFQMREVEGKVFRRDF